MNLNDIVGLREQYNHHSQCLADDYWSSQLLQNKIDSMTNWARHKAGEVLVALGQKMQENVHRPQVGF